MCKKRAIYTANGRILFSKNHSRAIQCMHAAIIYISLAAIPCDQISATFPPFINLRQGLSKHFYRATFIRKIGTERRTIKWTNWARRGENRMPDTLIHATVAESGTRRKRRRRGWNGIGKEEGCHGRPHAFIAAHLAQQRAWKVLLVSVHRFPEPKYAHDYGVPDYQFVIPCLLFKHRFHADVQLLVVTWYL